MFYYATSKAKQQHTLTKPININSDLTKYHNDIQESRYVELAQLMMTFIDKHPCPGDLRIFIEGYSFGSKGAIFNIAENTSILKHYLWNASLSYDTLAPTQIKKYATDKGNANKEAMQEAFVTETGIELKSLLGQTEKQWNPSSDLIDAYYIAKMGHHIDNEHQNHNNA